jgi:hypothetical protein
VTGEAAYLRYDAPCRGVPQRAKQNAVDMPYRTRRMRAAVLASGTQKGRVQLIQVDGAQLLNTDGANVWLDVQPQQLAIPRVFGPTFAVAPAAIDWAAGITPAGRALPRKAVMVESSLPRFLVRQDGSGTNWMVWDRLLKRPARLKGEEKLSFSAAEALRDSLNADHQRACKPHH